LRGGGHKPLRAFFIYLDLIERIAAFCGMWRGFSDAENASGRFGGAVSHRSVPFAQTAYARDELKNDDPDKYYILWI
jgi:hypothetical protein